MPPFEQQSCDRSAEAREREGQHHHQPAPLEQCANAAAGAQVVTSLFRFARGRHVLGVVQAFASTAASASELTTRP